MCGKRDSSERWVCSQGGKGMGITHNCIPVLLHHKRGSHGKPYDLIQSWLLLVHYQALPQQRFWACVAILELNIGLMVIRLMLLVHAVECTLDSKVWNRAIGQMFQLLANDLMFTKDCRMYQGVMWFVQAYNGIQSSPAVDWTDTVIQLQCNETRVIFKWIISSEKFNPDFYVVDRNAKQNSQVHWVTMGMDQCACWIPFGPVFLIARHSYTHRPPDRRSEWIGVMHYNWRWAFNMPRRCWLIDLCSLEGLSCLSGKGSKVQSKDELK